MNKESCSCGSERTRRETSRSKERERKRKRAGSAIRVISYGCLVETGTTLVSINRRPISRPREERQGGRVLAREIGKGGTRRRLTNNNYGPGNITGSASVIRRLTRWVHYVVHEIRSPGRSFPSRHRDRRSFLGSPFHETPARSLPLFVLDSTRATTSARRYLSFVERYRVLLIQNY